ncbi:flagellar basal body rod protein FlgC [Ramlibacter sp.]|uniref:flagellar basal body rod protein FlgC n=1 Tax=Ramlibacter sp. TaxID=1917967 RepID=UPI003D0D6C4F
MNYTQLLRISEAGMSAERARIEAVAQNMANANTVASPDGATYQPRTVLLRSVALPTRDESFAQALGRSEQQRATAHVPQATVVSLDAPTRSVWDPGHPAADAAGFVRQPRVDAAREMLTFMNAMRSYEANVYVASATRALALKTLEIGGGA